MKNKIIFDSCIIVAASVFVSATEDVGITLKHHFYEDSIQLFSLVKKNLAKRIGVVTTTIENEALGVLSEVIRGEIRRKYEELDRETLFRYHSIALNTCDTRMRNLLAFLQREPVDPYNVAVWFTQVTRMYEELEEKAKKLKKVAYLKAKAVPPRIRRMADWFKIYKTNDIRANAQLYNLLLKKVEPEDQKILAEACYLLNLYKATEGKAVSLFIASTDHHFSPARRPGWVVESRQVTDEIEKRFGVVCDWPKRIYEIVSKRL